MGVRLMVEILDHWQDAGLTAGERSDLLVLAENANDRSRETWPKGGVHQPYILKRAGKTAGSWKNAIAKLMKKGVLVYAVHGGREMSGFPGQAAVYRIPPMCPVGSHDGLMGQCARIERVTPEVTRPEDGPPETGHLSEEEGHLSGGTGHLSDAERDTPEVTPTPLYPSSTAPSQTPSSSPAEVVETEPPSVADVTDGGGGGDFDLRSIAEHITANLDYFGQVPDKQQQERLTAALVAVLRLGWAMEDLAAYLQLGRFQPDNPFAFYLSKLTTKLPDTIPARSSAPAAASAGIRGPMPTAADYEAMTVNSVLLGEAPTAAPATTWQEANQRVAARTASAPRPGTDTTVAGWGDVARQLREHKPYSNDAWSQPADPAEAARVPHCGDWDCDPISRMRDGIDSTGLPCVTQCENCHPKWQMQQF